MIKIAVCDDEDFFCEIIKKYVEEFLADKDMSCEVDVFHSGEELLNRKDDILKYQIVFLDISMREMDGIETASVIRKYSNDIYLIFVTAFVDYTLEGYKVEAFRYILKKSNQFKEAIEEAMNALLCKMNIVNNKMHFKFKEGEFDVVVDKICYIESQLHKLNFYMSYGREETYTLYEKLNDISVQLKEHYFLRIHQSFLVNMKHIQRIERYKVVMKNGDELPIARVRYNEIRAEYVSFKGEF